MQDSILFNTDSYKGSMWKQYPPGTKKVHSYIAARGPAEEKLVWFGLQTFILNELMEPIHNGDVKEARDFWNAHGIEFNYDGWSYIADKYEGELPLLIRQIPEGTVVRNQMPLATVMNTDDNVPWLTTWIETPMLRPAWYGTTVATRAYNIKKLIHSYLVKSGDVAGLPFKLHEMGARGVSSYESSGLGDAAFLTQFQGTDTIAGIRFAQRNYATLAMLGFTIPASEHSTITSWGRDNELDAYRNMIEQFKGKMVACVSDSYDIYKAVRMWGTLAEKIKADGTTLVVRPDSGDPVKVLMVITNQLAKDFGFTVNQKGYKVLNNVRLIWSDGINELTIDSILRMMVDVMGFSADNFAFGMGGQMLQAVTRDTHKFAMKASAALIGDKWVGFSKDPVTDRGKKSMEGLVTSYKDRDGSWRVGVQDWEKDALETVYHNGHVEMTTFEEVRERSWAEFA